MLALKGRVLRTPVLRWALYEVGKAHARASAPDHAYYAQVKDRCNGKGAALSEARKLIRQAVHILNDLGDDALKSPRLYARCRSDLDQTGTGLSCWPEH